MKKEAQDRDVKEKIEQEERELRALREAEWVCGYTCIVQAEPEQQFEISDVCISVMHE